MTDKKDNYYQPWLRDSASPPTAAPGDATSGDAASGQGADEPLAKPQSGAPTDGRNPAAPPAAHAMTVACLKTAAVNGWRAIRAGSHAFAEWTIAVGARADIPARVEAMEIPRRTRDAAQRSGVVAGRAARTIGVSAARAGRATAASSRVIWHKMALSERAGRLSRGVGRGLGEATEKTKSAIGRAAAISKDSIGEAAEKLRPAPYQEPPPPSSGLEQLLAREGHDADKAGDSGAAGADLPLFTTEAAAAPAPVVAVAMDDRAPHGLASPATATPGNGAPPVPPRGGEPGTQPAKPLRASSLRGWPVALAATALLALAFWAGGRMNGGMTKGEVETIVADYIKANPQIIPEALEAQRAGEIATAIDAIRPALEKPYAGAWAGNADGDVTLVVFTDYACGFCRASVPDIDRLVREDRRVKVVYRELPIIAAQSRDAALMALAAARQGKYDAFHHAMFAASSLGPGAIAAAADRAGVVTDGSADATANEALFQREIDSNLAIATQLQLNATPSWVVGDQLLQGQIGYDALKAAVAKARAKA